MGKRTLLIINDTLKKGGAEVLLVGLLPELNKKFDVILVTLSAECDFNNSQIICKRKYTLGFTNKLSLVGCIIKLNKIIKQNDPAIIHSHLFFSSLIARIACPSHIPLIYSVHGEMSKNVFNNSKLYTFLERSTIKNNHTVIAVSNTVLEDYENTIRKNKRAFVLKNYIQDVYLARKDSPKRNIHHLKLVAVGNIKAAKNYGYLIKAFDQLKKYNVTLDIYGEGNERTLHPLKREIESKILPITFKGQVNNPEELLPAYDVYVSCSKHEGFGLAAVEAMASGLPLLLSDLPVYHEVVGNNALFFDLSDPVSFANLIREIFERKYDLKKFSKDGIEIAKSYSKEVYLSKLFSIYDHVSSTA